MQIPVVSPNLLIITILVLAIIYGVLAGKHKLRILILSVYVGIVLAEQLTRTVAPWLGALSTGQASLLLFAVPILVFGLAPAGVGHRVHGDKGSVIANAIVGLLTGALIVASGLRLLPVSELSAIDGESYVAMLLQQYQLWLLGGLPVVAFFLGLVKTDHGHHPGRHHK